MIMSNNERQLEVLSFRKGDKLATIVTDGEMHRSFEWEQSKGHATLKKAIAYLESRGYSIMNDVFNGK